MEHGTTGKSTYTAGAEEKGKEKAEPIFHGYEAIGAEQSGFIWDDRPFADYFGFCFCTADRTL